MQKCSVKIQLAHGFSEDTALNALHRVCQHTNDPHTQSERAIALCQVQGEGHSNEESYSALVRTQFNTRSADALLQVQSQGYSESQACIALTQTRGNFYRAVEMLTVQDSGFAAERAYKALEMMNDGSPQHAVDLLKLEDKGYPQHAVVKVSIICVSAL